MVYVRSSKMYVESFEAMHISLRYYAQRTNSYVGVL